MHRHRDGCTAAGDKFVQRLHRVRLAVHGALHVHSLLQGGNVDGAGHGEIGPRTGRQVTGQADIHIHAALGHRGRNSFHPPVQRCAGPDVQQHGDFLSDD